MQAAIEVVVTAVADHIQQPDETSGPATAFVVVNHVDGIRVMPQLGEQLLELRVLRQQAGGWWLAQLGAFRVDEACPGNMSGGIARAAGQVDQNQFRGIQAAGQVSRFDNQWQLSEDSHAGSLHRGKGEL
ncbi:hypothetical protein FQZ97_811720 [compost metagenome]